VAETLLTSLPARDLLKPGRRTGELAGYRWRIDVAALNVGELPPTARFVPFVVNLRLQAPSGQVTQFTTVRLAPRGNE
jgi:general secretion pathway protein I